MTDFPAGREPIELVPDLEPSEELLSAYLTTRILVWIGGGWREWSDAEFERDGAVYVITAHNPYSIRSSPPENESANEKLRKALEIAQVPYRAAVGQSYDREWEEAGFAAAGWSREAARRWGNAYGQHAVFEIAGEELRVVECRTGDVHKATGDDRESSSRARGARPGGEGPSHPSS